MTHHERSMGARAARLSVLGAWLLSVATCTRADQGTAVTQRPPKPPAPPTGLVATAASANEIDIQWTNVATDATGIRIERCPGPSCTAFAEIATVAPSSTSYHDLGLIPGTSYSYRTRAFNAAGTSATYSNTSSAATPIEVVPGDVGVWSPLGPSGTASHAGRINGIAVDPRARQTIYVGASSGGVWKTTDGGTTWKPLTDDQCSLAVGALVLDPANPDIVYAGTSAHRVNNFDLLPGCGVLRSTNGGASWEVLGPASLDAAVIFDIAVDKATAGTTTATKIFIATSAGVYVTSDGGATWSSVLGEVTFDIVQDPSAPSTVYASTLSLTGGPSLVYRSRDGGATWTQLAGGLPSVRAGLRIALDPTSPSTIFAGASDGSIVAGSGGVQSLTGVYVSRDGGDTWSSTSLECSCGPLIAAPLVVPGAPTTLLLPSNALYRSSDAGRTVATIRGIHVDQRRLVADPADPNTVYLGTDGGVYRSTDGGATWASINGNLATSEFYHGISIGPTGTLLGGTQDNMTAERSPASGTWNFVALGDGGFTAIDPVNGATAYATCPRNDCHGPLRRDGTTGPFLRRNTGIVTSETARTYPPLVMDRGQPNVLYFGTTRLYRTTDRGDSWTPISPDLGRGSTFTRAISAIAPAPSDARTIYVGTGDGNIQITGDLGQTWHLATGVPQAYVWGIAVDGRDARTAYAVFGELLAGQKVYRTADGGLSWQNITFNLPNVPTYAVAIDPRTSDVHVGTAAGVFRLPAGASQWTAEADGLPHAAVTDLVYDAPRRRLVAATYGRGMFSLRLAP